MPVLIRRPSQQPFWAPLQKESTEAQVKFPLQSFFFFCLTETGRDEGRLDSSSVPEKVGIPEILVGGWAGLNLKGLNVKGISLSEYFCSARPVWTLEQGGGCSFNRQFVRLSEAHCHAEWLTSEHLLFLKAHSRESSHVELGEPIRGKRRGEEENEQVASKWKRKPRFLF